MRHTAADRVRQLEGNGVLELKHHGRRRCQKLECGGSDAWVTVHPPLSAWTRRFTHRAGCPEGRLGTNMGPSHTFRTGSREARLPGTLVTQTHLRARAWQAAAVSSAIRFGFVSCFGASGGLGLDVEVIRGISPCWACTSSVQA